jgi:hypothetical protein
LKEIALPTSGVHMHVSEQGGDAALSKKITLRVVVITHKAALGFASRFTRL